MKVFKIPNYGFCFGVKRSIDIAHQIVEGDKKNVYTYGPLIHNPQVVRQLEKDGLIPIVSFNGIAPGKLVIRSHGVTSAVIEEAEARGFEIVDATCPFVKRAQNYAKTLYDEGYKVVVIGESEHPEVHGIVGQTNLKAQVVSTRKDVDAIKKVKKLGIVAQTTISPQKFESIVTYLLGKADELRIYNTICRAVILRQQDTLKLADRVELMIVVGGRNSANTVRLTEISLEKGCLVYHIETKAELKGFWFKNVTSVGVTAGASTPDWITEDVIRKIKKIGG